MVFSIVISKFKISGDCSKCDSAGNMKATRVLVYAWEDCFVLPEIHICCTLPTMKKIKRLLTYDQIIFTDCYTAYSENHLAVYMDDAQ